MKSKLIPNIFMIFCSALMLAGCSKTVDFKNVEISSNLLYEKGENKGFTGKITNMPLNKMPVQNLGKIVNLVNSASSNKSLGDIFMTNELEAMTGNGYGRIVCDTVVENGTLDGVATCKVATLDTPLLSFAFKKNSLDGKVTIYDVKQSGSVIAESLYNDGQINGPSKVYAYGSGKLIYAVNWKNGIKNGTEEKYDQTTANLVFSAEIENGQYNGNVKKYSADGNLLETKKWIKGEPQGNAAMASIAEINPEKENDCLDEWINAFRKAEGAETMITSDQTDEWEKSCESGKHPG